MVDTVNGVGSNTDTATWTFNDILVPIDPKLGPLADNGGPTLTHALLAGSPAIDAGDPAAVAGVGSVPAFDQRGAPFGRVSTATQCPARIDIGAFEIAAATRQHCPGDYNNDGTVDAADYVMWRKMLTVATSSPTAVRTAAAMASSIRPITVCGGPISARRCRRRTRAREQRGGSTGGAGDTARDRGK